MRTSKSRSIRFSSLSTKPYSRKFNDTFNFLLSFRFACVPVNHYCFSDVQQKIGTLLLQYNSQIIVLELICGALFSV